MDYRTFRNICARHTYSANRMRRLGTTSRCVLCGFLCFFHFLLCLLIIQIMFAALYVASQFADDLPLAAWGDTSGVMLTEPRRHTAAHRFVRETLSALNGAFANMVIMHFKTGLVICIRKRRAVFFSRRSRSSPNLRTITKEETHKKRPQNSLVCLHTQQTTHFKANAKGFIQLDEKKALHWSARATRTCTVQT